jgi:5-methylcytosine-specific restriction endonuclease McrA
MAKFKKLKTLEQWLIPKLRRISISWPEMQKARDRVKVYMAVGKFKNGNPDIRRFFLCQGKDCGRLCKEGEGAIDHIKPVVDEKTGYVNLDTYIRSLLCDSSNLQYLCNDCHSLKTQYENSLRNRK